MSLVSSSTAIVPPPSKPTLNLRGMPKSERSLRIWKCHSRANGRVSISSCGSMPAVGVPVTLRILSAPEPREHALFQSHQHVGCKTGALAQQTNQYVSGGLQNLKWGAR